MHNGRKQCLMSANFDIVHLMKKVILLILITLLTVSCSTEMLDRLYKITSGAKENRLFHGAVNKLADDIYTLTKETKGEENRIFASAMLDNGSTGPIIEGFSSSDNELLSALVMASGNTNKTKVIKSKLTNVVSEEELISVCKSTMEFYNDFIDKMNIALEEVYGERISILKKVLPEFKIKESKEYTYRDVIAFRMINYLLSAFLSYPTFANETYTPEKLVEAIDNLSFDNNDDLNNYISNVTRSLADTKSVLRSIGDGPVLTYRAVSSVLDALLES